jgi:hypothetical protein
MMLLQIWKSCDRRGITRGLLASFVIFEMVVRKTPRAERNLKIRNPADLFQICKSMINSMMLLQIWKSCDRRGITRGLLASFVIFEMAARKTPR